LKTENEQQTKSKQSNPTTQPIKPNQTQQLWHDTCNITLMNNHTGEGEMIETELWKMMVG